MKTLLLAPYVEWLIVFVSVIAAVAMVALFYRIFFKRLFDIAFSFSVLIIFSPIILVISLLVRIKLGSPIIFKQRRPGKNGKIFVMHKFRTMADKRDASGNLLPDKDRLTKFGTFLRSLSIDELPQLWDILRGKMSLIGPRPQLMESVVFMSEAVKKRHSIRGGITGLAQVSGRNNLSWEQRFECDIYYVKNLSLWLDIKIFFKTICVVLKRSNINTNGMAAGISYGDDLLNKSVITQMEYEDKIHMARTMTDFEKVAK